MADSENPLGLNDDEFQLVADLAADFSERVQEGENPPLSEYADKLPNDPCREVFRTLANMAKFISITVRVDRQRNS